MTISSNNSLLQKIPLQVGSVVTGVWNKRKYRIERLLGSGANGVVYYVTKSSGQSQPSNERGRGFAMKIGMDAVEFQSEINALSSLEAGRRHMKSGVGRISARPFLVESDDVEIDGKRYPFYIMRYVQGVTLSEYLGKRGLDWFGVVGGRLLRRLAELHAAGWIFSDLKAENVLVTPDGEAELVDYGGLTRIGSSVRQFTEWYDRGYWNGGLRSADIGYDLFAYAVLMVHLYQKDQLKQCVRGSLPQVRQQEDLMEIIRGCSKLRPYQHWLHRAIYGTFVTTDEALVEWQKITQTVYRSAGRPSRPTPRWLKFSFVGSLLIVVLLLIYGMD
ncbi:protein kinase domain-containing protein [Paenibacillus marinisediminis]